MNTGKSYKTCPSIGNCTFNFHFFRNFDTLDSQDYHLEQGTNTLYEAYGYAAQYKNFGKDRNTQFYVVGDVQNIYLENLTAIEEDESTELLGGNEMSMTWAALSATLAVMSLF